jgi:peptidyl-tRNA hydrolase, PTH1 family
MKLICGLGNPGREYERHRHNIGFRVVEVLCARAKASLDQDKFQARFGQGTLSGDRVLFVQPQTFMNESGQALAGTSRFFKVPLADVLVIHDELDMPFGRLQLKQGGGTGGHNGLESIVERLGDDGFVRLRFGIDKPHGPNAKERVIGHVLSGFTAEEQARLPELIDRAADAAECWVGQGLATAMNRFNRKEGERPA